MSFHRVSYLVCFGSFGPVALYELLKQLGLCGLRDYWDGRRLLRYLVDLAYQYHICTILIYMSLFDTFDKTSMRQILSASEYQRVNRKLRKSRHKFAHGKPFTTQDYLDRDDFEFVASLFRQHKNVLIQRAEGGTIREANGRAKECPTYYNHNLKNWDDHIQRLNPHTTSASSSAQGLPLTRAPPDPPISGRPRGNPRSQSHQRPKSKGHAAEIEHLPAISIAKPQGRGRGRARSSHGRGHGRGCASPVAVAERSSKP